MLQINWKPVIAGIVSQIVLGLITIRWEVGRNIFRYNYFKSLNN